MEGERERKDRREREGGGERERGREPRQIQRMTGRSLNIFRSNL